MRGQAGVIEHEVAAPALADEFRAEVRSFLAERLPAGFRGVGVLPDDEVDDFVREWRSALCEQGYLAVTWPEEYGGRGRSTCDAIVLAEELTRVGAPHGGPNDGFGIRLCGNAILHWGTKGQKAQYLPRILSGDDVWCQGYSEPGAGSDLANVSTRGVLDGDEWVVDGQKIWTSAAHLADHIFVLCRTDPDAPKHKGISFLLMDMRQPGVEVRPITMMSGAREFNEVFFTGARVPVGDVVGGVNNGWAVAMTVLGFERGESTANEVIRFEAEYQRLEQLAKARRAVDDPIVRQELARCYTRVRIMRWLGDKVLARLLADEPPGPEASINKLFWSEHHQRVNELAVHLFGADALGREGGSTRTAIFGPDDGADPTSTSSWVTTFLNSRAATIYAGTSEVQRTIVGERVLGLPKEPSVDPNARGRA